MDAKLDLVKSWLGKAQRDLDSAKWLATLAAGLDKDFLKQLEAAELLTPFATAYRYPGERLQPELEEFQVALQAAETLLQFVCDKLPAEMQITPESNNPPNFNNQ